MKEMKIELTDEVYQNLLDQADENGRTIIEEALAIIAEECRRDRDEALLRAGRITHSRNF